MCSHRIIVHVAPGVTRDHFAFSAGLLKCSLCKLYSMCIRSFAGEKPHQCDVCEKRFSSTSNLKTHLRLHSGQKPYACDICPAKFTQFVHLKLHKRLHTNERPYICPTCSKRYISPSGLRTHWKTTNCRPSPGSPTDSGSRSGESSSVGRDEDFVSSTTENQSR